MERSLACCRFVGYLHVVCSDDLGGSPKFLFLVRSVEKCIQQRRFPVIHLTNHAKDRSPLYRLLLRTHWRKYAARIGSGRRGELGIDFYTAALLLATD